MNNINELLVQAQAAHDAADWSGVLQCVQQLTLGEDAKNPEIVKNQAYLLELALCVLEMGDFQQRWEIGKVFVRLGNVAITPLIDILEDEDAESELRWYAVRILGELKNPIAIASLVKFLQANENEELKAIAAAALAKIGQSAVIALSELLASQETRVFAVRSLSYIRKPEIIAPLLSVVQDPLVEIRAIAIEALSSFADPRIPPILLNALTDVAAAVRREAVLGLSVRTDLHQELDLVGKLQPKLYDLNIEVAQAAAVALSRIGSDEAAKHLFLVLISPQTPIKLQLEVVRALSWIKTSSSLEYLQQAFDQLSLETVWLEIVTVLGRVSDSALTAKATGILLSIVRSQHPAVEIASIKSTIALSLGQLGNIEAIEPLISLLTDNNEVVRLHIVAALKNLAAETVYNQLQQLLNNPALTPDLREGVTAALAEW
ncbi:HEAT repeat domain-containing protein [Scytonema hofmannii FACHB-248]|uniref:HEAT repeat domain-containing protein n=1 Tax=Scytonema hofmannii FACHB-248 TaxID=1842502 RepID=A0ABR8GLP6_9CYAN|nr:MULTISPECIES: HEAT repeat domain-containing protein [Nostocales]MBD2604337.1 HEAT repeat domain-containing protein [Scytonema hofmannii FACHB-248]